MPSDARHKRVSEKFWAAEKIIKNEFLMMKERCGYFLVRSAWLTFMIFFCNTAGRIFFACSLTAKEMSGNFPA